MPDWPRPFPPELELAIFKELVSATGSSNSLLASVATCRHFFSILTSTSSLWTYVRIDTKSFRLISANPSNTAPARTFWPGLSIALRSSQGRPISLEIVFDGINKAQDTLIERYITPFHLNALKELLLRHGEIGRVRELVVRCAALTHITAILEFLNELQPLLNLETFTALCTSGDALGLEALEGTESDLQNPVLAEAGLPSTFFAEHSQARLPRLERVFLQGILLRYPSFFPTSLTSLSLFDVVRPKVHDFMRILEANRNTLQILELGHDVIPTEFTGQRLTLRDLFRLSVAVLDPRDLIGLVHLLDLPSLTEFAFTDVFNKLEGLELLWDDGSPMYSPEETAALEEGFLRMYDVVRQFWPLGNVKRLFLKYAVFYEHPGNAISLLPRSRFEEVDWDEEGRGVPLASKFFAEFTSLESLLMRSVHQTVLVAFHNPPYRYDEKEDEFTVVYKDWFPCLKSDSI
ncbi:hypothetical protein V5O48_009842 [Marasmius crinis-equi]|uniref:F-box domain-containing protein n=1 Tax=Marasmius crinis-equi TaxID=585013 RepID=A0ABR3FA35_9AGAR